MSDNTAAETKSLFENYKKAEKAYEDARAHLEVLQKAKSDAVKAILDAAGSGPFKFEGRQLTVSHKGDSYFFKGKKEAKVVEVD